MSKFIRCGLFSLCACAILWGESALAQYGMPSIPGRKSKPAAGDSRVPTNMRIPFEGTATIESVAPGGMEVSAQGARWLVHFDRNCKVEITGTADPSFLKPGLMVRFNAELDKKGKAIAPLNELEIVSPQTAMVAATPRVKGAKAAAAAAADAAKKAAEAADKGDGEMPEPTGMLGRITAVKNSELTIETGGGSVRADLGANPVIKINSSDYSLAQQGDKAEVKGWYVQAPEAMAQSVKIALSAPLGGSTKKAVDKATTKAPEKTASK